MVLFSIGLPSRFADWCDALLLRIAESRLGSTATVALNSLEELAAAVIRSSTANLIVSSRQPVVALQTAVIEAARPFLVALGDPRTALRNQLDETGCDLAHATRTVASSCAAIIGITKAANALMLNPTHAGDQEAVAAAIAEHFQIPIGSRELASIVEETAGQLGSDEEHNRAWLDQLDPRARSVVNGALEPYIAHFAGGEIDRLVWEPELFFVMTDPPLPVAPPAAGPIDITGRPRALVFGPYINLPPGVWSAEVVLGFSAEAAGTSFFIEICAGPRLAETHVQPSGEQVIETNLQFTIDGSANTPIEIRIFNERAAFDGRLALGYAAITPQRKVAAEIRQRLVDVLHP